MKFIKFSFCSIFIIIIAFFGIMTIQNNESVSSLEKRNLQTFPQISLDSVVNGTYTEELINAFSDQLEFRDFLIKGYYLFQLQKYNGDVVKGSNGELYAAYQRVSNLENVKKQMKTSATLINGVANDIDAKFIFLSIPRKDAVETKNLPDSYISSDTVYKASIEVLKENLSSDVYLIDGYEIYKNDNHKNRYYYMTDHHITPRGAYLLYEEILKVIDDKRVTPYDLSNYEIGTTIINGSFNNQIGQSVKPEPEELYLIPKFEIDYIRYEEEKISDLKIWDEANTYENAYMKGDKPYTIIDTNRSDLPNILFVGSSFTNILEALSVPSFNKMVSIDYRHNTTINSINYYVEKHDIDYVIFIPSQSNNALSSTQIKTHLGLGE